jgi:hypothetical protein
MAQQHAAAVIKLCGLHQASDKHLAVATLQALRATLHHAATTWSIACTTGCTHVLYEDHANVQGGSHNKHTRFTVHDKCTLCLVSVLQ